MGISITETELRGRLLKLQEPQGLAKYYYLDPEWGVIPDGWDEKGNLRPKPLASSGKLGFGQPVISPYLNTCAQLGLDDDTVYRVVNELYPGQPASPRTQALEDRVNRVLTDHLLPDGQIDDQDAFSQDIRRAKAQRLPLKVHAQGAFEIKHNTIKRLVQNDSQLPELVRQGNQILADYMDEWGIVPREQTSEFKQAIAAVVRGETYLDRSESPEDQDDDDESADRLPDHSFDDRSHRFFNHRR